MSQTSARRRLAGDLMLVVSDWDLGGGGDELTHAYRWCSHYPLSPCRASLAALFKSLALLVLQFIKMFLS